MTGLWITLFVIAGILLLLLMILPFVPIKARTIVNQDEISLTVSLLFFRKKVLSAREKPKKLKNVAKCPASARIIWKEDRRWRKLQKRMQKKKQKKWLKKEEKRLSPKLNLIERLTLIRKILQVTGEVTRGRVTVRFDKMHLRVATGDAASTAILYGTVLQTTAFLMQWVEDRFAEIERNPGAMTVQADYTAKTPSADIDFTAITRAYQAIPGLFRLRSAYREEQRSARRAARRRINKISLSEASN